VEIAECIGVRADPLDPHVNRVALSRAANERELPKAIVIGRLVENRGLAPERIGQLLAWHGPSRFGDEVGEGEAALSPREALLADQDAVDADRDPPGDRNRRRPSDLAVSLPETCRQLAAPS
jgi:hypothetical protein